MSLSLPIAMQSKMRNIVVKSTIDGAVLTQSVLIGARSFANQIPTAGLRKVQLIRAQQWEHDGCRLWLALENLQVTGSFKLRGALYAMMAAQNTGITHVVTASAGNHGAGIAHAAHVLDMNATVFVPRSAPARKLRAIDRSKVRIERVDGGYDEAQVRALACACKTSPFLSPYDDEHVASGNGGSLGFEIVESLGHVPQRVICPIGGGGLATGMGWALGMAAGEDPRLVRRVWTVQSEASPAFALSLEKGKVLEQLELREPTLAEGLEGGITRGGFARAAAVVAGVSVVTEKQIGFAMKILWQEFGMRVEGSAAAALVPILAKGAESSVSGDVVIVLTGRNVDEEVFRRVVDDAVPC